MISSNDSNQITIPFDSIEKMRHVESFLEKSERITVAAGEKIGNHKIPYIRMFFKNYEEESYFDPSIFCCTLLCILSYFDKEKDPRLLEMQHQAKYWDALKHYFPKGKFDFQKFNKILEAS